MRNFDRRVNNESHAFNYDSLLALDENVKNPLPAELFN